MQILKKEETKFLIRGISVSHVNIKSNLYHAGIHVLLKLLVYRYSDCVTILSSSKIQTLFAQYELFSIKSKFALISL